MNNKQFINIRTGKIFPRAFRYLGYLGILFSIISIRENFYIAILLLLICLFLIFGSTGKQFDIINKKYKICIFTPLIKVSGWKPFVNFPFIAVINRRLSETTYGGRTMNSITITDKYYDICLLTEDNLKRINLLRFKNQQQAYDEMGHVAKKLDVDITEYRPIISSSGIRRKR